MKIDTGEKVMLNNTELHNGSLHWYAVYTKSRHEKKVVELLTVKGIESYLPLVSDIHNWSDRKQMVQEPLIRGYVFVRILLKQTLYVLETYGVVRIVTFKRQYATIPDFQIDALKRVLECGVGLSAKNYLQVGKMVEISSGPMKGVIGKIQRIENKEKFVIALDAVQMAFEVQVNFNLLKPVSEETRKKLYTLPLGIEK
ncbi:MAG: antitermination protein NusG [Candidatus Marinimicrobia bacterium CG08_land_8_20_14_0_20_45_22]|nr:MAG: antitermination protein NusG [Candidatus Marinimicrobia bacterium CG08_land_8_20_14_0_20_45_22]